MMKMYITILKEDRHVFSTSLPNVFFYNSNTQTLSEDNALVKMAKERQPK